MPFKDKQIKKDYLKRYYINNLKNLKLKNKSYRVNNRLKIKQLHRKYLEDNREKINENARKKYNNNSSVRFKRLIRAKTINKYGKLKNGFVYHHNTEPYHEDKFNILEKGFHDYYHKNKDKFKLKEGGQNNVYA